MRASSAIPCTSSASLPLGASPADSNPGDIVLVQEQRWITAAAAGDLLAFEKLMTLQEDRIFQLCLRLLGCREDALEASQDVFVKAHRALPRYQATAKFSTWLCQIAVNRCRDLWKHSRARLTSLSGSLQGHDSDPVCRSLHPGSRAEVRDDLVILEKGLRNLGRKYREVLILTCIENLPYSECAGILNCSERAIEGRVYRARKLLQGWWERNS